MTKNLFKNNYIKIYLNNYLKIFHYQNMYFNIIINDCNIILNNILNYLFMILLIYL